MLVIPYCIVLFIVFVPFQPSAVMCLKLRNLLTSVFITNRVSGQGTTIGSDRLFLFPRCLLNKLTFDIDFLHVYGS